VHHVNDQALLLALQQDVAAVVFGRQGCKLLAQLGGKLG
jgi:hypothetical protein